jgi:putative acetyltransferase
MTHMMIEIRDELPDDDAAIRAVHVLAFGREAEAHLVELLRDSKQAPIALVATTGGQVIGHIMFSPVTVADAFEGFQGIALAPVAVLPEFQNQGIGSKLIRDGLEACRRAGYDVVVVLGHTTYYPRFGFSRASDYGLTNEYNAQAAFMVMELRPGTLERIGGLVKYVPAFREASC